MSDTRYFHIPKFMEWQIFLADDSPEVIRAIKDVFQSWKVNELKMDNFALLLADIKEQEHRIAILDGTFIIKETKTSSLDKWLENRHLQSNDRLFLVGYSGDEINKTERCVRWYVKGTDISADVKELRNLCRKTATGELKIEAWPLKLPQTVDDLSRVIHRVQNLLLPIDLDAKTLAELTRRLGTSSQLALEDKNAIEEVFKDHFGRGDSGYIGKCSDQHEGTEISSYILNLLRNLSADTQAEIEKFTNAVKDAQNWSENPSSQNGEHFMSELSKQLVSVSSAGDALVTKLRDIRRTKMEMDK